MLLVLLCGDRHQNNRREYNCRVLLLEAAQSRQSLAYASRLISRNVRATTLSARRAYTKPRTARNC